MMNIYDEWTSLADFLTGIIEKYAVKMNLDNLPDPDKYYKRNQIENRYRKYMKLSAKQRAA